MRRNASTNTAATSFRHDSTAREIGEARRAVGIAFVTGMEPDSPAQLDFHLPAFDVHIEVKRFHSPRITAQMARVDQVIVAQGDKAVRLLARAIRDGLLDTESVSGQSADHTATG